MTRRRPPARPPRPEPGRPEPGRLEPGRPEPARPEPARPEPARPEPASAPPARLALRPRFWERVALDAMTRPEWEALCDGCGKCCLNKLEDPQTGEVAFTRVACRLLDGGSCRCTRYATRRRHVPECVVLTPRSLPQAAYFMPETCAYRRLHEGRALPGWHPLETGDPGSVHAAGASVRGWTVSEALVDEDDWEDHIVEEPV